MTKGKRLRDNRSEESPLFNYKRDNFLPRKVPDCNIDHRFDYKTRDARRPDCAIYPKIDCTPEGEVKSSCSVIVTFLVEEDQVAEVANNIIPLLDFDLIAGWHRYVNMKEGLQEISIGFRSESAALRFQRLLDNGPDAGDLCVFVFAHDDRKRPGKKA